MIVTVLHHFGVHLVAADTMAADCTSSMAADTMAADTMAAEVIMMIISRTCTGAAWTKIEFGIFQGALGILGLKGVRALRGPKMIIAQHACAMWGPGPIGCPGEHGPGYSAVSWTW